MNKEISNDIKIKLFDELVKKFFGVNFGYMSKSEIEIFMFGIYMKINENEKMSDYDISRDLGITQSRVRNLRVKNYLISPSHAVNWQEEFKLYLNNAKYENGKIIISIMDPNVMIEITNYLEQKGFYNEIQLNSKLLVLRSEFFIDLLLVVETESNKKQIIKRIKQHFKDTNKDNYFDEKNVGESLINAGVTLITTLESILEIVANKNIVQGMINSVSKSISNIISK
ncbi:MAG: hypothetical protein IJ593_04215 [Lachnospiraceae bacterium]|nr:hypothetical protein [Lachnospiraceae bacterium]